MIFSFDPVSLNFKKLKDFNGTKGAYPMSAFIEVREPPIVSLISPAENTVYLLGGNVYFNAKASDIDGTISKVEFYSDGTLLYTAADTPYNFKWEHARLGEHVITAKATDNEGLVTISDKLRISVVRNKPPAVGIITPSNGQTFIAGINGATINLEASAQDADGRIVQVRFYHDGILLTNAEHKLPYTYQWNNVGIGVYIITAVAKDNWSEETTSLPVNITVLPASESLVRNNLSSPGVSSDISNRVKIQLAPIPASNVLNINVLGVQKNKRVTLSIISSSGAVLQTRQLNNLPPTIKLDVSSLTSGMYILKLVNGEMIIYSRFLKF